MAAHEHLATAQFHRREGRPSKHEHSASDEENSSAPKKPRVRTHSPGKVKKHGH
jgi:hypothetical protein